MKENPRDSFLQAGQQHRLPDLGQQVRPVVAGGSVHAQAHVHTRGQVLFYRRDPGGQAHVRAWTVCHTAAMPGECLHFITVHVDRMGKPDILSHPVHGLHVRDGTVSEFLQAESLLVLGLGQVCVQVHTVLTRQPGRLLHQFPGHAERRAGRQDNLYECPRPGVMVGLDQPLAVAQDVRLRIHHRIGRQPAFRFAQRHGTAGRLYADADLPGSRDLIIEPGTIREQVQVVGCSGAAGEGQFGQGGLGGNENVIRRQACPDGIERLEPVEQVGILCRPARPASGSGRNGGGC